MQTVHSISDHFKSIVAAAEMIRLVVRFFEIFFSRFLPSFCGLLQRKRSLVGISKARKAWQDNVSLTIQSNSKSYSINSF
jgi:hypothetical protein